MPALATVSDLETRLGTPIDDPAQAQAYLDDVSAAVRAYTGQLFTRLVTTDRLRARRGLIRLPQRPVNSVDAVTLDNGLAVAFTWFAGDDRVCIIDWDSCCSGSSSALVTYDHGYDVFPGDVIAVVCNIALRALGTDPLMGSVQQRSISNYQEMFGPVGASGTTGLFRDEASVLDRYRRVGSVAWTGVG
jgi:hypothetical protein